MSTTGKLDDVQPGASGTNAVPIKTEVDAITVKSIPFWPNNPVAWFGILERQFIASRVQDENTRYIHAVSMMDQTSTDKCMDIIQSAPLADPYSYLKRNIIRRLGESDHLRLQRLFAGEELGDGTPTQLLARLKILAEDKFQDDALKTLWLKRLPNQVQAILAGSTEDLENLAKMADRILETISMTSIAEVSHAPSRSGTIPKCNVSQSQPQSDRLTVLEQQMSTILNKLERLESNLNFRRPRSNSNNFRGPRPISQQRSISNSRNKNDICRLHLKYGDNANKCYSPCNYKSNSKN